MSRLTERPGGTVADGPTGVAALPPEAAQGKVFLSYKREDREAAALADALGQRGVEVWVDRTGIPPGADWVDRVGVAITNARAVVAVVSRAFLGSVNCRRELEEAERAGKRIVPVVLDDRLVPEDLPVSLRTANWIPWGVGVDEVAERVATAVSTDVGWLDEHARLHTTGMRLAAGEGWSVALRGRDLRASAALLDAHEGRDTPPFVTTEQRALVATSRVRRRVWAAGVVAALLVVVLLATNLVQAATARRTSESERLAATADALLDTQLDLAVRLALHAGDVADTDAARVSLVGALTAGPGLRRTTAVSAGLDRAALASVDGPAAVVDEDGRPSLVAGDGGHVDVDGLTAVTAVAVDGEGAVLGTAAGRVVAVDVTGERRGAACDVPGRVVALARSGATALVAVEPDGPGTGVDLLAVDESCGRRGLGRVDGLVVDIVAGVDGTWAAVGRDGALVLGRLDDPVATRRLSIDDPVAGAVGAVALRDDTLVVGRVSGRVEARPLASPEQTSWSRPLHQDVVTAVAVTGTMGASTSLDGAVVAWDLDGDVLVERLTHAGQDAEVSRPLAVAVADGVIETVTRQGDRHRWSTAHDSPLVERLTDGPAVGAVVRDGGEVVVAVRGGDAGWPADGPTATALAAAPGGAVVAGFEDGTVASLDTVWATVGRLAGAVTHVASDGTVVAAADGADLLVAVDDETTVVAQVGPLRSLAVAPDGTVLGGADGEVRRWARDGAELDPVMTEHSGTVDAITVPADGARIVTGGDDRSVRIWDPATYTQRARLVGHGERVLDVSVSSDGRRMASVDEAGELHHWDLDRRAALLRPMRHPTDGLVRHVAFVGPTDLVTTGPGAFRWRLSDADVRAAACELARPRVLTDAESAQLLRGLELEEPCR